ncbi:MAG: CDP-glycerol glycerophosphotransferase family protein [Clostridia bacterium]|nr:CDP-glycerol glycerophosphotransferase family protein [Clostridia bacterium]
MQILWKVLGGILRFFGMQNYILFEAEPAKRENTEAVFNEMLRRGLNKRYKLVLCSYAPELLKDRKSKNVLVERHVKFGESKAALRRMRWLRLRSRLIIDENQQISKLDPKTTRVYLTHGSCLKSVREYYNCKPDADFMLNQAEFWKPINAYEFRISEDKLVTLGYPRNDILFSSDLDPQEFLGRTFAKLVVWYPTYRQLNGYREKGNYNGSVTIPVIHDEAAARRINEYAAKHDVLLVVKPHPVQDVSYIKELQLDHLIMVNDRFFMEHHTPDYAFIAKADALITDYSSVVFDYMLTEKPIALTLEDLEEYKKQIGIAIDMDLLRSCSAVLNSPEDFDAFFADLVNGNDPLRERRLEVMHLTNRYTDGNSAKRVVDWLETFLKK